MYQLTCDGFPLLDWRDNELILVNPKVKLEVNTVGEGSFTIYKNHPYYDKLQKLKSVFEVSDETSVIFRGRATGDSRDFDHGMAVDLEGAMAYFNDSVVRPYDFPNDFLEDADYIAAANGGNVVAFFLSWLIDNHNSQVQDFQRLKLGNVTVSDPNNYITRSNSKYSSTWETLKAKLFNSALGGYLCIRYEEDGNYIDYLSEFTETNSQKIVLGENLIDLKNDTEASQTYSAIIPFGAADITIEGQPDGDLTDDLVKSGDTIYSRKAVAAYGWIYAPTSETTWDDVTDDANLVTKGAEWLANEGILQLSSIEATAVDLHFTDEQVESLRIYKNVDVYSKPHEVTETFPLDKLEIDLLNSQNTKIKVGKTLATLTERASVQQDEAKKQYSKISKSNEEVKIEVKNELDKLSTEVQVALESLSFSVVNGEESSTIKLMSGETEIDSAVIKMTGVVTFAGLQDGTTKIDGGWIETNTISADKIKVSELEIDAAQITGTLTIGTLPENVATTDDIPTNISELTNDSGYQTASGVAGIISSKGYVTEYQVTTITNNAISTASISANQITAGTLNAGWLSLNGLLEIELGGTTYGYVGGSNTVANGAGAVMCGSNMTAYVRASNEGAKIAYSSNEIYVIASGCWSTSAMQTGSDIRLKNSIEYDMEKYEDLFMSLKPCSYYLNNDYKIQRHWGFIAQDFVEGIINAGFAEDEIAALGNDGEYYGIGYTEMVPLNTHMIQRIVKTLAANGINILEG